MSRPIHLLCLQLILEEDNPNWPKNEAFLGKKGRFTSWECHRPKKTSSKRDFSGSKALLTIPNPSLESTTPFHVGFPPILLGMENPLRNLKTHILHVILVVQRVLLVPIHPEEELGGAVARLAVAAAELGGQQGGGAEAELAHRGHPQQLGQLLGAAAVQGFRPARWRGSAQRAGLGVVRVVVRAAFALSGQQRFPFSGLVLLLEAGRPAQAVPAGAAAAPGAAGGPVGTGRAAEAGLGEKGGREGLFAGGRQKIGEFCPSW